MTLISIPISYGLAMLSKYVMSKSIFRTPVPHALVFTLALTALGKGVYACQINSEKSVPDFHGSVFGHEGTALNSEACTARK